MAKSAMMSQIKREKVAWIIKWCASILLVLGMSVRSSGIPELQILDLSLSFMGVTGWLVVSIIWEDRALILLNAVGFLILLSGLIKYFFIA